MYLLITFGYTLVICYDLTSIYKGKPLLRAAAAAGYPLTLSPLIGIPVLYQQRISPPISPVLWAAAGLCMLLVVYSAVIEPARFARKQPGRACASGTYRFSRHPGWLWFTAVNLLYLALFARPAVFLLLAYATLANFAVIWVQDRYLFPKLFANYREYQSQVPFLL